VALLLRKYNNSLKTANLESQQSPNLQAGASEPAYQGIIQEPKLISPTYGLPESAYSNALLSADDLNTIRDMWSTITSRINTVSQDEYNLADTAGVNFVSNSGDFELSIEMYRFVNDTQMALKVAQALKDIYLRELGYQNTYLACPVAVNETSWILSMDSNKQFLLGKAIPFNFISIRISSEAYIDAGEAAGLLCKIVEKQVDALQTSGF